MGRRNKANEQVQEEAELHLPLRFRNPSRKTSRAVRHKTLMKNKPAAQAMCKKAGLGTRARSPFCAIVSSTQAQTEREIKEKELGLGKERGADPERKSRAEDARDN